MPVLYCELLILASRNWVCRLVINRAIFLSNSSLLLLKNGHYKLMRLLKEWVSQIIKGRI